MIFNSVEFILFFPICVTIYYILPYKWRNVFLLIASYYFYMCWIPHYALLLFFSTIVTYLSSIAIERSEKRIGRLVILVISLLLNLGVLFYFKYYNFFIDTLMSIIPSLELQHTSWLLPVGISFYTFQTLGYTIDVYRQKISGRGIVPERNFITYALFVSFFPQLVAGPIERSNNLLPQFHEKHTFSIDGAVSGLQLILVGLFKKIVIADMIAMFVDEVYSDYDIYGGLVICLAILLFTIQIYCDFSGYSDIARGAARIMGFKLMLNFNAPYLSASVKEFWNRWHISLSTWFKDYIYIPLGGCKKGFARKLCNLMIIFVISGLWHGAARAFILWGILHGTYRIVDEIFNKYFSNIVKRIPEIIRIAGTFILVSMTWNFFRAESIHQAIYIFKHCLENVNLDVFIENYVNIVNSIFPSGYNFTVIYAVIILTSCLGLFILDCFQKYRNTRIEETITKLPGIVRWAVYYGMIIAIMFSFIMTTNEYGQAGAFIYFQF